MICPSCKSENREKAKFCTECGAKLELVCPKCENKLRLEAKFCDECGHNFKQAKRVQKPSQIELEKPQRYIPQDLKDKILETVKKSIDLKHYCVA